MTKFKFFIGGYFGTNVEVKLEKEDLLFYISDRSFDFRSEDPTHIISIKDNLDWQKLVKFLATLEWEKHYRDEGILDGNHWEISFRTKESKLKSSGSNEYPIEFKKFIRLLNAITRKHYTPFEVY